MKHGLKKFYLSAALILIFVSYTITTKRNISQSVNATLGSQTVGSSPITTQQPVQTQSSPAQAAAAQPSAQTQSSPAQAPAPAKSQSSSGYSDGQFIGNVSDAYYGNVQVEATVQNGRVTDVKFLQYPSDRRTSLYINSQAMPILTSEAISAQSSRIDVVSGATDTSHAFIQSLSSALNKSLSA